MIINMSSVAGLIAAPMYSIYARQQVWRARFTDTLRREVSPFGIRVSGIYPGPAVTEFGQHPGKENGVSQILNVPRLDLYGLRLRCPPHGRPGQTSPAGTGHPLVVPAANQHRPASSPAWWIGS